MLSNIALLRRLPTTLADKLKNSTRAMSTKADELLCGKFDFQLL